MEEDLKFSDKTIDDVVVGTVEAPKGEQHA